MYEQKYATLRVKAERLAILQRLARVLSLQRGGKVVSIDAVIDEMSTDYLASNPHISAMVDGQAVQS